MSTQTAPAAEPAAATGGTPTLVTQTQPTDYQSAQPASANPEVKAAETPGKDQPTVETKPAEPSSTTAPVTPSKDTATPSDSDFKLPDEYKDKPWAALVAVPGTACP